MSSKPETTFYTAVHRHLPPEKALHREKMCNPFRGGTWDFWFSGKVDLWIEYKFVILPKRDDTMVTFGLSDLQEDWGRQRRIEGRNLAVIVGSEKGGIVLLNEDWLAPISCNLFKERLMTKPQIAAWIVARTGGSL
jgi:hypothetical protein